MLLRAAGLPRHALRLEDTDMAHRQAVTEILTTAGAPIEQHETILQAIVAAARYKEEGAGPPEHRALADARREKLLWEDIRRRAEAAAMQWARPV
jgi:hypothetical protein